jgi:hypothetical protein
VCDTDTLSRFSTKSLPQATLYDFSVQLKSEVSVMATNILTTKNGARPYGLRFGCVNTTNDPNCNKCAERLANALNSVLRPTAQKN